MALDVFGELKKKVLCTRTCSDYSHVASARPTTKLCRSISQNLHFALTEIFITCDFLQNSKIKEVLEKANAKTNDLHKNLGDFLLFVFICWC